MVGQDTEYLKLIAKAGLSSELETTTIQLAEDLNSSQQSVSRKLIELEKASLIKRELTGRGIKLSLTAKGRDELRHEYSELKGLFEKHQSNEILGEVTSGIRQGGYYVNQFIERLSKELKIKPFPGTLNLRVNVDERDNLISSCKEIFIPGFTTKERTFGWVKCYHITLGHNKKKIDGFITVPERTVHKSETVEIISEKNIRETLNIKDGDKITIASITS